MLTSSLHLRLEPETPGCDRPGPYVHPGASVPVLAQALREVDLALQPASLGEILEELGHLAERVAPRNADVSPENLAKARVILAETLRRYPADAAIGAIRQWPETPMPGCKFWPTDSELLQLADKLADYRVRLRHGIDEALRAAKTTAEAAAESLGHEPVGRTRELYEQAIKLRGRDWAFAWLNRRRCLFSDRQVITTPLGVEFLNDALGSVAKKLGVRISTGAIADEGHGSAALSTRNIARGPALSFVRALRQRKGEEWVELHTRTATYYDDEITLRGFDLVAVRRAGADIAESCGVRLSEA